jgi:hypothetical protein
LICLVSIQSESPHFLNQVSTGFTARALVLPAEFFKVIGCDILGDQGQNWLQVISGDKFGDGEEGIKSQADDPFARVCVEVMTTAEISQVNTKKGSSRARLSANVLVAVELG